MLPEVNALTARLELSHQKNRDRVHPARKALLARMPQLRAFCVTKVKWHPFLLKVSVRSARQDHSLRVPVLLCAHHALQDPLLDPELRLVRFALRGNILQIQGSAIASTVSQVITPELLEPPFALFVKVASILSLRHPLVFLVYQGPILGTADHLLVVHAQREPCLLLGNRSVVIASEVVMLPQRG